jgi:hypothetical protein
MSTFDALQSLHDSALGPVRRGAARQRARILAVKLGVETPEWARIRPPTGGRRRGPAVPSVESAPTPDPPLSEPAAPPAPPAFPPQAFTDVRAWARAGASGERALAFAGTGAVTLISFVPGEQRAASFQSEAEALAAIASGAINWRAQKRSHRKTP